MASFFNFIFFLSLMATFISSTHSLTCSSQTFPNRSFTHCTDLPTQNASLHWAHNPKNSSLSVAFLASPPKPGGWVAWAVNPSATGMVGAQAFLASLSPAAAPTVRTFNLSSYAGIHPANLSFPVFDLAAEFTDGRFTIFATFKVPPNSTSLNQIWQTGPAVDAKTGAPVIHEFKPANLASKGVLEFDGGASPAPRAHGGSSPSPAPLPAPVGGNGTASSGRAPASNDKSGVAGRGDLGAVVVGLFAFILGTVCF